MKKLILNTAVLLGLAAAPAAARSSARSGSKWVCQSKIAMVLRMRSVGFYCEHGNEVKALVPDQYLIKSGGQQALFVGGQGLGNEYLFDRRAFLADFQI